MYVMILYDIGQNAARRRVVRACKDEGLRRLQYSVFIGHADIARRDRISATIRLALGDDPGVIHILPMHRSSVEQLCEIFNPWPDPDEEAHDAHDQSA